LARRIPELGIAVMLITKKQRPRQLWPFCGQNSRQFPLLTTTLLRQGMTLRVSQRKRIDLFSVTYKMAALAEVFRLADSQSSNPGSIPGSATNLS
jgi:hypothetical protein